MVFQPEACAVCIVQQRSISVGLKNPADQYSDKHLGDDISKP